MVRTLVLQHDGPGGRRVCPTTLPPTWSKSRILEQVVGGTSATTPPTTTDNRACTPRPPGARAGLGTGWMRPAATSRSRRRRARCPAGTGTPCHPRTGLAVGSVAGHTTRYKCLQGARPATCRQSIFHNLCKPIDGPGQLTWVEACHAATRRLQLHQGRHVGVVVCKGSPNRSHTLTNRGHTLPYTK